MGCVFGIGRKDKAQNCLSESEVKNRRRQEQETENIQGIPSTETAVWGSMLHPVPASTACPTSRARGPRYIENFFYFFFFHSSRIHPQVLRDQTHLDMHDSRNMHPARLSSPPSNGSRQYSLFPPTCLKQQDIARGCSNYGHFPLITASSFRVPFSSFRFIK